MGFWQALGSFLEAVLSKAGEVNQEAINYKQEYADLDNAELKRRACSSSKLSEKTACLSILQDRGNAASGNSNSKK